MMPPLPGYFSVGEGDPVVLLHATLSSKRQWKALASLLTPHYRVIAVDLYGYGDTPLPPAGADFTLEDEVELVRPLLAQLLGPHTPFHLVGHSYGGAVALAFCHFFPHLVRTLTAFEPVAFHLLEKGSAPLASVAAMAASLDLSIREGRPDAAAETFLDFWGGRGTFAGYPPRLREEFTSRTPKLPLDFKAITATPITPHDYQRLQLPVTILSGTESHASTLAVAELLTRTIPHATLLKVPAGHLAPLTHPDLVNPLIHAALAPSK